MKPAPATALLWKRISPSARKPASITSKYDLICSGTFTLGLGYTRSEYDSFGMTDGIRVYKERNRTKSLWGPTQAGISLVWKIGSK